MGPAMTSPADPFYGRWGGLEYPLRGDFEPWAHCWTCRTEPAAALAVSTSDSWPVCGRCQAQGVRLKANIEYRPLIRPDDVSKAPRP